MKNPTNDLQSSADHPAHPDVVERALDAVRSQPAPEGLGVDVLLKAADWSPADLIAGTARSRVLSVVFVVAPVGIAAALLLYFNWFSNSPTSRFPDYDGAGIAGLQPSGITSGITSSGLPAPTPSPAALMGVYRTHFQSIAAADAPVMVATGHQESLPVGAYLSYRRPGSKLHVWNWNQSTQSQVIDGVEFLPYDLVALTPDGKRLLWANGELLDLTTKATTQIDLGGAFHLAGSYHEHTQVAKVPRITRLEFTPDGKHLLISLNAIQLRESDHPLRDQDIFTEPRLQIVEFPSGKLVAHLPVGLAVSMSHNNRDFYVTKREPGSVIAVHALQDGKQTRVIQPAIRGFAYAVTDSPDGKYLAAADSESGLLVWNIESGNLHVRVPSLPQTARRLSFSPSGKYIASSNSVEITIIEVATGEILATLRQSAVEQVYWSSDDAQLTAVSGLHYYEGGPEQIYVHLNSVSTWDWRNDKRVKHLDTSHPQ